MEQTLSENLDRRRGVTEPRECVAVAFGTTT
jgi:hypothetical protein